MLIFTTINLNLTRFQSSSEPHKNQPTQIKDNLVVRMRRHAQLIHLDLDPLQASRRPNGDVKVLVGALEELVQVRPHQLRAPLRMGHVVENGVVNVKDEQLLARARRIPYFDLELAHTPLYLGHILLAILEAHFFRVDVEVVNDFGHIFRHLVYVLDHFLARAHHHYFLSCLVSAV